MNVKMSEKELFALFQKLFKNMENLSAHMKQTDIGKTGDFQQMQIRLSESYHWLLSCETSFNLMEANKIELEKKAELVKGN